MRPFICLILTIALHTLYLPTPLSNAASTTRIKVAITSKDSSQRFTNTKAESYLKRELRKFSDVEIVTDSPDYVIIGVAGELTTTAGYVEGYIFTTTILKRQDLTLWNINLGYDVFTVIGQQYGYNTDIESICRDFAVTVDTDVLEMQRQMYPTQ